MDPNMPTAPVDAGNTSRGRSMLAAGIIFMVLSTLVVVARFWSRTKKRVGFGWDDWLIAIGLPFYFAQMGCSFWGVYGTGLGAKGNMKQLELTAMELTIIQYPYATALFLIRMSICALYLRIFVQRWVKIAVGVYVFVAASWLIFLYVVPPAACQPFAYNWDKTIEGGHCNNVALLNSYTVNGVWSIILDFFIWVLPQSLVWQLEMPTTIRVALSAVFAIGVFDIVVACIRLSEVRKTVLTELTYTNWPAQMWSCVEVGTAIIVACLPQCKPAFELIIPRSWLTQAGSRIGIKNSSGNRNRTKSLQTFGGTHSKKPNAYYEIDEDSIELTGASRMEKGFHGTHTKAEALSTP